MSAGAYSAPPDSLAGFEGAASWQEGNGGEGREELGGRGEGKGKGGSWGNNALVVGRDRPPCLLCANFSPS